MRPGSPVPVTEVRGEVFKGHNLIVLPDKDEPLYPVRFGYKKAKVVLAHIEAIRKFVEAEEASRKPEPKAAEVESKLVKAEALLVKLGVKPEQLAALLAAV